MCLKLSVGTFYETITIDFTEDISAFGFYATDVGDFNGQVTIDYIDGSSDEINIGNTIYNEGGSVLYFGFYDLETSFESVTFGNTAPGADWFGFDNLTIGTHEQIDPNPTPEPSTIILLSAGLLGLAARRKSGRR